eukprot:13984226-Alexandrium_andersonii.AAC.1
MCRWSQRHTRSRVSVKAGGRGERALFPLKTPRNPHAAQWQRGWSSPSSPRDGHSGDMRSAEAERSIRPDTAMCKHRLYNTPEGVRALHLKM